MWTVPSNPSLRVVAVPARRVSDLPLALVRTLRSADRCAATAEVFDVVALARMPAPTERLEAGSLAEAVGVAAVGMDEARTWGLETREAPAPLQGITVVSTRAAHQTAALAERLEAYGAEVVALPAIAMVPPADLARVDETIRALSTYQAAVFTSENGVVRTFERVRACGLDARAFAGLTVAAIGPGTSAALTREGVRADVVPDEHVGEALAQAIASRIAPRSRVAILRASEARDVLPLMLRDAGHQVEVTPVYTTVRAFDAARFRALVARGTPIAITFTSASTATSVVEALTEAGALETLASCARLSIGPITTDALANHGVIVNAEAKPYTLDGLVDAFLGLVGAGHFPFGRGSS